MEASNNLVSSRFRFIIGKIKIFTPEEEKILNADLGVVMH